MELKDTISKKHISSFTTLVSEINNRKIVDPECISEDLIRALFNRPQSGFRRPHRVCAEKKIIQKERLKRYWGDPKNRELASVRTKKRYESEDARRKTSAGNVKRYSRIEEHIKSSISQKNRYRSEDNLSLARLRCIESAIGGIWYGNVRYYLKGPQYCEKWNNDLKERVRTFFNYRCVECGTPQNGIALHVHHVWYNKSACCDSTPRSLVPLCVSCHSKTSGKSEENRMYWSNHFQEIIDTYYCGKCYFTKEEMQLWSGFSVISDSSVVGV